MMRTRVIALATLLTTTALVLSVLPLLTREVAATAALGRSAETFGEALPRIVVSLSEWPGEEVLFGRKRVAGDENRYAARAKNRSIEWIEKVLSPKWLPADTSVLADQLIMLRDEIGLLDVTRVQWERNGYSIQLSQTLGIIAVELRPLGSANMGTTTDERRRFAADLCAGVVRDTGMRYGPQDERGRHVIVPVTDLAEKIRGYSFRPELMRQFPDGIAGVSPEPFQEGLPLTRDGRDVDIENRVDNPEWDKSTSSWGYWWRHVCWWHDGRSVGFYTLKVEAGSWAGDFSEEHGESWFEGERRSQAGRRFQGRDRR